MNILVAEDERDLRDLLKLNLENEGYSVSLASNGRQAYEMFLANQYDLGIFDIMMPLLDGFNLLRMIREKSELPVILLTARGEEMDKVLGFGLGADDYLVKPFSMVELIARIGARLRKNSANSLSGSGSVLNIGCFSLDRDACCISKNGEPMELNAKEYLLLKFFMEYPNKVFTKKQLYSAVWEDEFYNDDNTVMVHISHIRNKIEDDSKNPVYIKTIKGIGYKFDIKKDAK